jgi:hypothetical protein
MDRRKSILSKNANLFPGFNTFTKQFILIQKVILKFRCLLEFFCRKHCKLNLNVIFLGECFENGPEQLTESPNSHPKPLKLTTELAAPDSDSMQPKLFFSRTSKSPPEDVPVMVLLVPFCPSQSRSQFPPIEGVISSKVQTLALADLVREK